ncbi:MAG: hypothetical protein M3O26_05000 [Pseudomonadota bacterium]|nr:hypothetical protein [Pseudomonadota bacterium]
MNEKRKDVKQPDQGISMRGGGMLFLLFAAMVCWDTIGAYHASTWVRLGSPTDGFEVPPMVAGVFALFLALFGIYILLGVLDRKRK